MRRRAQARSASRFRTSVGSAPGLAVWACTSVLGEVKTVKAATDGRVARSGHGVAALEGSGVQ